MKNPPGSLARRLAHGLATFRGEQSQNQFARALGVSNASLNRIENRVQNVSLKTLETLCRKLRCDIGDLFPPEPKVISGNISRPRKEPPGGT